MPVSKERPAYAGLHQSSDPTGDQQHGEIEMLPIPLSRVEQSRAHVMMTQALGGPTESFPQNGQEAARCGAAEALAFHSNGCHPYSVARVFALAEKVMLLRDLICEQDAAAIYDLTSLEAAIGDRQVAFTVAKLCGAYCKEGVWRDAEGPASVVTFPKDLEDAHIE